MSKIYITSDLHFCHDREFLYKPRGFNSIEEHDNAIVENWNSIVNPDDDVYVLGDLMLNDTEKGIELFNKLNGNKLIILGNHDTESRVAQYNKLKRVIDIYQAFTFNHNGYHFYLSHYPTITTGGDVHKKSLKYYLINLYGHTHQKTNFFKDIPFIYHVGLDSHDMKPVLLDDIIEECNQKFKDYK